MFIGSSLIPKIPYHWPPPSGSAGQKRNLSL
jgi:hypothetical protein